MQATLTPRSLGPLSGTLCDSARRRRWYALVFSCFHYPSLAFSFLFLSFLPSLKITHDAPCGYLALLMAKVHVLFVKPIHSHCDHSHQMDIQETIISVCLVDTVSMQSTVPLQNQDRSGISLDTSGSHQFFMKPFCSFIFLSLLTMIICSFVSSFHILISWKERPGDSLNRSQSILLRGDSVECVCWWEVGSRVHTI